MQETAENKAREISESFKKSGTSLEKVLQDIRTTRSNFEELALLEDAGEAVLDDHTRQKMLGIFSSEVQLFLIAQSKKEGSMLRVLVRISDEAAKFLHSIKEIIENEELVDDAKEVIWDAAQEGFKWFIIHDAIHRFLKEDCDRYELK